MSFGEITSTAGSDFDDSLMSGILGLAYSSLSDDNLSTFIDSSNLLNKSFSMYLTTLASNSYMTIGGYDASFFTGPLVFHNLVSFDYWTVNLTALA